MASDTIAAIATPPGRGGIGIVRVSGPRVPLVAETLLGKCPPARSAHRASFRDGAGEAIDDGLALYFPAPHSFTGEHVLELHGHGGTVVLDRVLAAVFALGVRAARPGEFSERAFLNGKLDLAQAEAVADLIDSGSEQAARAALRSLSGEFSECVNSIVEAVTDLRAQIEASIDFPDEDADFLGDGEVAARVTRVLAELDHLAASARQGALLRDGLVVVIAGAPNAGKSSLLNRLAGHDAAIVTEVAGTTRDVLREDIVLDGLPVRIIDTAGLREAGDAVEQEGVRRARAEIVRADHVLMVVDATQPAAATPLDPELAERPLTIVRNKIDLSGEPPGAEIAAGHSVLRVSAKTGAGLDALRAHLQAVAGWTAGGGTFSARRRHLDALTRARRHVADGYEALETRHAAELCAEELRLAQQALGEITGAFTTEDLLGRIFTSFCIGK
ncbi:MAG: tRNA uridine-5-carboxymethylaminomethyl(34) synthesis GTPase MnmE [Gammaproteobacteria bacterium]